MTAPNVLSSCEEKREKEEEEVVVREEVSNIPVLQGHQATRYLAGQDAV